MDRVFVIIGSLLMFLGVAAGAFGAHGLSSYFSRFPELAGSYETAVRYHVYHALGLFAVAWLAERWPGALVTWTGWLLLAGIILFSGSLYLLVITRARWLGAITPIGGVAFLAGWVFLAVHVWRN